MSQLVWGLARGEQLQHEKPLLQVAISAKSNYLFHFLFDGIFNTEERKLTKLIALWNLVVYLTAWSLPALHLPFGRSSL